MQVPIVYLKGPVPLDPVVRAETLARYFEAASIISAAREEADALIASAKQLLADATRDAQRVRAEAYEEGLADAQAGLEQFRAALVAETVQWCIDESNLETEIATRIDMRIGTVIVEALAEFVTEQDRATRLAQCISERLSQYAEHRTLTLRVARERFDAASSACVSDEAGLRLNVTTDTSLTAAQAVIETPFVKICIDIDAHLQSVLSQLRGASNKGVNTPR
jgi:flagellar biosynthesis/type III secretory pathway protein FliH